ncbi:cupin domain-containing protein [Terricaulis sp.]|uniref:cupin domain-containing protein n=1 Tax=Terricaulis sp. TaxID=2768686 RepID=UPI0037850242
MSAKIHTIAGNGPRERQPVGAERLVEGAPVTETALDYECDGTFAGEWSAGVGAWRVRYDEWEFCHMLEGACELVSDADGSAQRFNAGDSFVIEPGFAGVWRVLAPMKKRFVVRTA